jgi:uncharacterized protein with PQ loop repeat
VFLSAAVTAVPTSPLAQVFGWTAGSIGIAVGWPQAWRLWVGRRHAGLSLTSNVLAVLYSTAWMLYGVACHAVVQIVTCSIGFGVASTVLVGHLRLSRPRARDWLPLWLLGMVFIVALFFAGRDPLGVTASAATIGGVLPQVVTLVRARRRGVHSVGGVSVARWVLAAACNVLWMSYGVLVHNPLIVVNSMIVGTLSVAIVILTSSSARLELLGIKTSELAAASLSCSSR